ncbi:MAG TPA: hypothetical protein DCZ95_16580 [Verrucomicrobia bacterium]|nr:MAG: hypothetical protein A2X46_14705 [Lentisphaerae bacterium GWF2_57_35]HBA85699.1 hypothetical protein [Verrucomicrobiota bacterium]
MSLYLYDGSIEGLLTAFSMALEQNEGAAEFVSDKTPSTQLIFDARHVISQPETADRLIAEIRRQCEDAVQYLFRVLMTENPESFPILFEYLQLVRQLGARANQYHAHSAVKHVLAQSRKVGSEIHRLKGLLRFRQLPDGVFWAPIEPDYNVTYAVAPYFTRRMADQNWIIHDLRRQFAAVWHRRKLRYGPVPEGADLPTGGDSGEWEALWQTYFKSVAIPERRNPRLQRQNMPARYWKYLIEKPQQR